MQSNKKKTGIKKFKHKIFGLSISEMSEDFFKIKVQYMVYLTGRIKERYTFPSILGGWEVDIREFS